jgi:hypothetical protein
MSESGPEDEENGGFRVVDRRRFDADGSDRNEDGTAPEADPAPAAASPENPERTAEATVPPESQPSPPESQPSETGSIPPEGSASADPSASAAPASGPAGAPEEPPAPTFSSLILSLSTQALFSLGEIVESPDAEPRIDLMAGKQLIDLLGVLQEKTSGNLDPDESELMERILYDLRLRFVEIARRSTGQAPEN